MLLQEKMKLIHFTPTESVVVNFILEKEEQIKEYSTTMIANETYTSPSILIRIAKKLGFNGYNDFKEAYLNEIKYLKSNFKDLDANFPFTSNDSIMNISHKIAQLKQESINDTLSLLDHDSLQKAVLLMKKSKRIKVFTIANLTFLAEELIFKLRHIGNDAQTYTISNTMIQEAVMTRPDECAILLSYSGESSQLLEIAEILHHYKVPIIAITSLGENSLTKLSQVVLRTTTREKSYTKIGAFTSHESISLLLDILYSCYFAQDYNKHLDYKLSISKATEKRAIDNEIIKE